MDIGHAIILSFVEGITEFLPISSTGHMILASDILRIAETDFLKSFEIIIQFGAILAVVSVYFKVLFTNRAIVSKLLVAFIPTAVVGLVLYKLIKYYLLGNILVVLWSLLIGGVVLIVWEKYYQKEKRRNLQIGELSYRKAFIVGVFQSLAIVPGVSRAAATIVGAMSVGLDRKSAVEFSFLLAVPTMAGATGLDLIQSSFKFSSGEWSILSVGFVGAFITAMISVKYFLKFVKRHTFVPFGIYRIVLALLFWILVIW